MYRWHFLNFKSLNTYPHLSSMFDFILKYYIAQLHQQKIDLKRTYFGPVVWIELQNAKISKVASDVDLDKGPISQFINRYFFGGLYGRSPDQMSSDLLVDLQIGSKRTDCALSRK